MVIDKTHSHKTVINLAPSGRPSRLASPGKKFSEANPPPQKKTT